MAYSAPVLEEVVSKVAHQSMPVDRDTRTSLLFNSETGETDGLLLESLLERVAVFVRAQDTLSLADVSSLRRTMAQGQARRADLYVLMSTTIQKPVMLLATLSKIRILRVEAPAFA